AAFAIRLLMLVAIRGSYAVRGLPFWCSWMADIPAALRLTLSTAFSPTQWRGRRYRATSS
ncbi:MAG: glycosyl transferase group 2 family protein, partial [Gemmatimonas sp.]